MDPTDAALLALLSALEARGYNFVTPLNPTLRTIRARRPEARPGNARDALGWSLPFRAGSLGEDIEQPLLAAGAAQRAGEHLRSTVRASRVGGRLFLHSAYPASEHGDVFLGPDSYRFARFIQAALPSGQVGRVCDIGAGAGVGGITAAVSGQLEALRLTDLNPLALRLARINAQHAGVQVATLETSGVGDDDTLFDLILANPPFISTSGRLHSDGGGDLGIGVSVDWTRQALARLTPGGRLLLYTGAPIVEGEDRLEAALGREARTHACDLHYAEIDPDIFGGELRRPAYATVERIAAVGVTLTRR